MSIEIKGLEEINETLTAIQALGGNGSKLLEEYVIVPIYNKVIISFEKQSSAIDGTKWTPLSQKTLKIKQGRGKILFDSGALQETTAWQVKDNMGFIGTNAKAKGYPYPAVHQFGVEDKTPKRPFLPINDNNELPKELQDEIERGLIKKFEKMCKK